MAPGGGGGNIAPFVVGKFIVKAVMGNLFKAPVIVVGIAYGMPWLAVAETEVR